MTNQKKEPISINKQVINWGVYSGVAIGVQKYTKTHVSGGGDTSVSSRIETIIELSIQQDSGKEVEMTITDLSIRVRDGQRVSGIWGYADSRSSRWLIFINHDTNDCCWLITPMEFFESLRLFIFLSDWWLVLFQGILVISLFFYYAQWAIVGMFTGGVGIIFCVAQRYRVNSAWKTIKPQLVEIVRQLKY